ncbi:unnamed protein product [Diamesa hyperborea]
MSKFIFIPAYMSTLTIRDKYEVFLFFYNYGILNVIMLTDEILTLDVTVYTFNPFMQKPADRMYYFAPVTTDINVIFPNKLTDLSTRSYKVLAFNQVPRVYQKTKHQFFGTDILFINEVATRQNTSFYYPMVLEEIHDLQAIYEFALVRGNVDLTVNTVFKDLKRNTDIETINTFDENGYCALIPKPPRTNFLQHLLRPFDAWTWFFLFLSIGLSAVLWALHNCLSVKEEVSASFFFFGVAASFLGQSIAFKRTRIIQVIMLQICIFATFILGNAYQSLIISLMSVSRNGTMYNSFNEVFNNTDFNFLVDKMFLMNFKTSDEYYTHQERMKMSKSYLDQQNYQQLASENTVMIFRCDVAHHILYSKLGRKQFQKNALKFYYLLPDRMYTFFEQLEVKRYSPFYDEFQRYSTIFFESGIRQYWNTFKINDDVRAGIEIQQIEDEEYLLNIEDLYGVFVILALGLATAGLVLIMEIFCFDCVRQLKLKYILKCCQRIRKPGMRVRRIQVAPMREETEI